MGITNSLFADSESSHTIKVISAENHIFQLNADELKLIFENDNIKDHYVMIVSIAGAFQPGKSFLLNIFLRYLEAQYKRHDVTDWLGENGDDPTLKGFSYQSSDNSKSNGMWMWSELFTHAFENGDKVAIALIDTQEQSDNITINQKIDTTFAMSILLSSVQCYYVTQNIKDDDLQRIQLIKEYGQLVHQQSNEKPFQKLLFIMITDQWSPTNDYGWNGEKEVERILAVSNDQTQDMQLLKNRIKASFEKVDGFLLPCSGSSVADGKFSGDVQQVEPEFRKYVKELAVELLAPENIILKKINGQMIRAYELSQYLQTYLNVLTSVESLQAQDIFNIMVESDIGISELKDFDIIQMEETAEMEQAQVSLQDEMDVWSNFGKLINLDINFDGALPDEKQTIYANSRNKKKLVITIDIEDIEGNPLKVGPKDLQDKLYLCDYETQVKLGQPWQLSDEKETVTDGDQIFVYKYISCSTINAESVSGNFSVGVIIPNVGEFNTSHYGTKTQNGKSGSAFHSPKHLAITACREIDYSNRQNLYISTGSFEPINSNLGWASRFSREGPYVLHNDGKCERCLVQILPSENSVIGQQEFKKYEIIEFDGIKNDEVNQFSAAWEFSSQSEEKCFDLLENERECQPCAVIGRANTSDYSINIWFSPDAKQIHIDGHVWTEDTFYFYRFCPYFIEKPTIHNDRGAVTLSLYKFKLPVDGLSKYGWKDAIHTVKIKVTDLYENEGTFELIFDDGNNFDKPGFK